VPTALVNAEAITFVSTTIRFLSMSSRWHMCCRDGMRVPPGKPAPPTAADLLVVSGDLNLDPGNGACTGHPTPYGVGLVRKPRP
jgi:hypothetical protein